MSVNINISKRNFWIIIQFIHFPIQDIVRVLAIPACYKISMVLSYKYKEQLLLSVLREIVHDPSWRVRTELAKKITQIQKGFGLELSKKGLTGIIVALLADDEPSVRSLAISKVSRQFIIKKHNLTFLLKYRLFYGYYIISDY